ncbi:hypothetical protein [Microbacterium hydrocarbonoxydans]|uniref:hypothetical protein n=1 Tax=Microbacterium hydrocarbonoxydans TaxID=273678 RepID=UPI003D99D9E2
MKNTFKKAAASVGAFAIFAGVLLGTSVPANAATDIDAAPWARVGTIAPWTTVDGCSGTELNLNGAYCVPAPDGGGMTSGYNISNWKQGATNLGGAVADGEYHGGPFGFAAVSATTERSTSRSVTIPLTQRFAEYNFTNTWAVAPEADIYSPTATGPVTTLRNWDDMGNGFTARVTDATGRLIPATLTPVAGGIRVDLSAYANVQSWSWVRIEFAAQGLRSNGTKAMVEVLHYIVDPAVNVAAQNLALTTPVNVPLDISETMLTSAVAPMASHVVLDEQLPGEFTPSEVGLTFLSAVPTTVETGFRGAVQIGEGWLESERALVTVTAVDDSEPEPPVEEPEPTIVAPTVRDFTFDAPQAKGDISTGAYPAEVPVLSLTEGEDFDPADWFIEAADVMPWATLDNRLYLFPEEDGVAFTTRWRWTSLADPSVSSEWATVAAPAAPVVEPPVEEEPPTEEPPVVEPPVVEPPVTDPPVVEPPAVTPQPEEKSTPTPFERVETDGGVPLGTLLPGGIAVLLMLAGLGIYGRFRRA